MRNVTITVDEEVAQWARVWAARRGTSVSRLLGELLKQRMQEENGYQAAMQGYLASKPAMHKRSGGLPTRGEVHERAGLR